MDRDNYGSKKHPPGCADTVSRCILFALIIILACVVVWAFLGTRDGARPVYRIAKASETIRGISMAMEMYTSTHKAFPPDNGAGLHPDLDRPAECLVYYLSGASIFYDPGLSPPDYPWDHEIFNVTRKLGKGRKYFPRFYDFHSRYLADEDEDGIPEVVDPWGNPFLYNTGGTQNGPFNQNGAPKHNKGKYDLSSAGPDGKHGTEDDITNWQGQ